MDGAQIATRGITIMCINELRPSNLLIANDSVKYDSVNLGLLGVINLILAEVFDNLLPIESLVVWIPDGGILKRVLMEIVDHLLLFLREIDVDQESGNSEGLYNSNQVDFLVQFLVRILGSLVLSLGHRRVGAVFDLLGGLVALEAAEHFLK